MDKFVEQHADRTSGTLACFDRVLFRGYLPIMSGAAMAQYLKSRGVQRETVKPFLLEQAARLKAHALALCTRTGRPYEYLGQVTRKEDMARKIAERDGIREGLVHFLSQRLGSLALATYDHRMIDAARALGFDIHPL